MVEVHSSAEKWLLIEVGSSAVNSISKSHWWFQIVKSPRMMMMMMAHNQSYFFRVLFHHWGEKSLKWFKPEIGSYVRCSNSSRMIFKHWRDIDQLLLSLIFFVLLPLLPKLEDQLPDFNMNGFESEVATERWKWTFTQRPSRRCHILVSSDWWVWGWPFLQKH